LRKIEVAHVIGRELPNKRMHADAAMRRQCCGTFPSLSSPNPQFSNIAPPNDL